MQNLFSAFAEEVRVDVINTERSRSSLLESELLHVEWLQEAPEDLDVAIAQRDFEGAVDLVERGQFPVPIASVSCPYWINLLSGSWVIHILPSVVF